MCPKAAWPAGGLLQLLWTHEEMVLCCWSSLALQHERLYSLRWLRLILRQVKALADLLALLM